MASNKASIKSVLDSISKELVKAVQTIYVSAGIKRNSDLVKSVEVRNNRNSLEVYVNDYVDYIESGRRKFAKKVPISALLTFIRKAKISPKYGLSKNELAYAIQNSIFQKGIKGKRGLNKKVEKVTEQTMIKALREHFTVRVVNNELIVGNRK